MQLISNLNNLNHNILQQVPNSLAFVGFMWIIHLINWSMGYALLVLGIRPRKISGLIGILFAPFLHAHFDHIFFNSIPLLILSTFLLLNDITLAIYITLGINLISGILTWLLARNAIHVGASSLILGYMGYLLTESYLQRSTSSWIIGIVTLYYLGSLLFSLFPDDNNVSFEGHISGFFAGIIMSLYSFPYLYSLALSLTPDVQYVFKTIQSVF